MLPRPPTIFESLPSSRRNKKIEKNPKSFEKNPKSFEKNPGWNTQPISQEYQQTSFSSIIKDGFALGIGSSLSNRLVDSIFGPRKINVDVVPGTTTVVPGTTTVVPAESVSLCKSEFENYQKCFQQSGFNDCQSYHDILSKCLNNPSR